MTDEEMAQRQPAPWVPERRPAVLALVGKLAEEADELAKIAARIVIQGIEGVCPDSGRPNRALLEDEIADVAALCGLSMQRLGPVVEGEVNGIAYTNDPYNRPLDYDRVEARREAKRDWFVRWLATLPDQAPLDLTADALNDLIRAAYIAGAEAVHRSPQHDDCPDFTEAAYDYAASAGVSQ